MATSHMISTKRAKSYRQQASQEGLACLPLETSDAALPPLACQSFYHLIKISKISSCLSNSIFSLAVNSFSSSCSPLSTFCCSSILLSTLKAFYKIYATQTSLFHIKYCDLVSTTTSYNLYRVVQLVRESHESHYLYSSLRTMVDW